MYGIFTYIYHNNQPNVGKYTSPMDPMGMESLQRRFVLRPPRLSHSVQTLLVHAMASDYDCDDSGYVGVLLEYLGPPKPWKIKVLAI